MSQTLGMDNGAILQVIPGIDDAREHVTLEIRMGARPLLTLYFDGPGADHHMKEVSKYRDLLLDKVATKPKGSKVV